MNNKNTLIIWSPTFSCGVKLIDEQHKGLVKMVNEMFNHVSGDEEEEHEYFNKIIKEAVDYIKVHFATEEKIMRLTKFEGFAEHKKEHDNFVLTVVGNIFAYRAKEHFTLLTFTKFLKDWVLSHIAVMDKKYFDHFKNTATRKANGKLSITTADIRHNEPMPSLWAHAMRV